MKRTKKITNIGMDGNVVQHVLEFNVKAPRKVETPIADQYIKDRNNWYLENGPEYLKQIIRDEKRY